MADLVTTTEYKAYAGITGTGDDAAFAVLIAAASRAIRRYCGRDEVTGFAAATYTEKYDGNGSDVIQLREWPLASVTSVTLIADDGTTDAYATTDYRPNLRTGGLYLLGSVSGRVLTDFGGLMLGGGYGVSPCWPVGEQNLSVVYVTSGAVPDDLKLACYQIVDFLFAERRHNPAMQSESLGAYSYTRARASEAITTRTVIADLCADFRTGVA